MLDADLANLHEVPTKALNQAVGRNPERFPADFMFQLTAEEILNLRSQSVTSSFAIHIIVDVINRLSDGVEFSRAFPVPPIRQIGFPTPKESSTSGKRRTASR